MSKLHLAIGAGFVGALSLFALSAVSDAVSARGWKGGEHHRGGYGHHQRGGKKSYRKLRKSDSDGNGEVTKAEFMAPKEKRFSELDQDGDGKLTPNELFNEMNETADYIVRRAMKDFDADNDAKISKDEYLASTRERFAKRDTDGDGEIGDDEKPPRWKRHRKARDDDQASEAEKSTADSESSESDDTAGRSEDRKEGKRHGQRGRWHKKGRHHGRKGHHGKRWGKPRSLEEALERRGKRFDRRDANSDGFIDADEIHARGADRMEYKKKKKLYRLDANKDGSVSKEEYLARSQKRFSRLDLDSDGTITATDLPPRAARRWQEKSGKRD